MTAPFIIGTLLESPTNPQGKPVRWTREEFISYLADALPHRGPKESPPLWSPATYRNNYRNNENVITVSALVADIDNKTEKCSDGGAFIASLQAALPGLEVFVHTSFSSKPGDLRFRPVVVQDRPTTPAEHPKLWRAVAGMLARGGTVADPSCKDSSRSYFIPAVPPGGIYGWIHQPGDPLPVDPILAHVARVEAAESRAREALRCAPLARVNHGGDVVARARGYLATMPIAVSGQHGHTATFKAATVLAVGFGLSDETAFELLSEWNTRCAPPWSERDLRRKIAQAHRSHLPAGWLVDGRAA